MYFISIFRGCCTIFIFDAMFVQPCEDWLLHENDFFLRWYHDTDGFETQKNPNHWFREKRFKRSSRTRKYICELIIKNWEYKIIENKYLLSFKTGNFHQYNFLGCWYLNFCPSFQSQILNNLPFMAILLFLGFNKVTSVLKDSLSNAFLLSLSVAVSKKNSRKGK